MTNRYSSVAVPHLMIRAMIWLVALSLVLVGACTGSDSDSSEESTPASCVEGDECTAQTTNDLQTVSTEVDDAVVTEVYDHGRLSATFRWTAPEDREEVLLTIESVELGELAEPLAFAEAQLPDNELADLFALMVMGLGRDPEATFSSSDLSGLGLPLKNALGSNHAGCDWIGDLPVAGPMIECGEVGSCCDSHDACIDEFCPKDGTGNLVESLWRMTKFAGCLSPSLTRQLTGRLSSGVHACFEEFPVCIIEHIGNYLDCSIRDAKRMSCVRDQANRVLKELPDNASTPAEIDACLQKFPPPTHGCWDCQMRVMGCFIGHNATGTSFPRTGPSACCDRDDCGEPQECIVDGVVLTDPCECRRLTGASATQCMEEPPEPPVCTGERCMSDELGHAGQTIGDPHLRTFDGHAFDMQAVGEFVMVRSTTDNFEVQARTTALGTLTTISVNAAIALRMGDDVIGLYRTAAGPVDVHVNHASVALSSEPTRLASGVNLVQLGERVVAELPEGGQVGVAARGPFLDVSIVLANRRLGEVEGLLGNNNDDPTDDFRTSAGQVFEMPISFEDFYGEFVESWRISDESSLFDYEPGESTATWTDQEFPRRTIGIDGLDQALVEQAKDVCLNAGVPEGPLMDNCILDVALTGDTAYALAAAEAAAPRTSMRFESSPRDLPAALQGEWIVTGYQCSEQVAEQRVAIEVESDRVTATKLIGDGCVGAGEVTWEGTYRDGVIEATFHVASAGPGSPLVEEGPDRMTVTGNNAISGWGLTMRPVGYEPPTAGAGVRLVRTDAVGVTPTRPCGSISAEDALPGLEFDASTAFAAERWVKGRISPDEAHYWNISLEPGEYNFVLDSTWVEGRPGGNRAVHVSQLDSQGQELLPFVVATNDIGFTGRAREVLQVTAPTVVELKIQARLQYTDDYALGVFPVGVEVPAPRAVVCPALETFAVPSTAEFAFTGPAEDEIQKWFEIADGPGTYRLEVDSRRTDGTSGNLIYYVHLITGLGDRASQQRLLFVNVIDVGNLASVDFRLDASGPAWLRFEGATSQMRLNMAATLTRQ